MGNVYFDCQSEGVRTTRNQVSESCRNIDYPYNFYIETLPFQSHHRENLVQTRRWCERNLQYDVYFDHRWKAENGRITSYYWVVYFEAKEDAVMFKLKWGGNNGNI
jgi:hypothetical protein